MRIEKTCPESACRSARLLALCERPEIEDLIARLTDAEFLAESLAMGQPQWCVLACGLSAKPDPPGISDRPEPKLGASGVWLRYRPDVGFLQDKAFFFGRLASLTLALHSRSAVWLQWIDVS